jgi:lysozyme
MMNLSENGIEFIKKHEGLRLKPYLDSVGVPTIGYGNTFYEDGIRVKLTDNKISKGRADELFYFILLSFESEVSKYVKSKINQNQFDALVSFSYNVGIGNLKKSTLLKKVNINPKDVNIIYQFGRWNKAKGKVLKGLTKRRKEESLLYFS